MIEPKDCYLRRNCKKYKEGKCEGVFCQKLFRVDSIYNNAGLSEYQKKHIGLLVDKEDEVCYTELYQISKNIQKFVTNGSILYLWSKIPGNGKTSWALKFLQSYIDSRWYEVPVSTIALFINVPKFFTDLKASFSEQDSWISHVRKYASTVELVVWDDIGTKGLTEFEREMLLSIINARIENRKANIFTSNCNPRELEDILQPRLASRILSTAKKYEFRGKDKRYLMNEEVITE